MTHKALRSDVGIVGLGFAGCATATLLARAGHRVTVYERAATPHAVGAGILLQPSGLRVLQRLGVLEQVLLRGARIEALTCRTQRDRRLFELSYRDLGDALFGLGMHRGALFEILFGAMRKAGVEVRTGCEVARLRHVRTGVQLTSCDGAELGRHELLVVADGARSTLRKRSPALQRARPYPFGALWFIGQDPEQRFAGVLSQTCAGTERMLGFLPSGLGPLGGEVPLVSLFWSIATSEVDALRARGLDAWKSQVLAFEPRAEQLLRQIEHIDQLLPATYMDAVMSRFHDKRVAYVGDAAHSTSPQLGQGTNLALVDAACLSDCLAAFDNVSEALRAYSDARIDTSRFYQFASRWLTPLFQSDATWLGHARDALFPWLVRLPLLHRQMLLTLAGHKHGFLAEYRASLG